MFNIDHKIKKYSNKLGLKQNYNYLKKLSEYIFIKYNTQTGGNIIDFYAGDNYEEKISGLVQLIVETVKPLKPISTQRKYCMIVMGPTGSGKTLARKIGFNLVRELEPSFSNKDIENSFIDISVDDYVYGATINTLSGKTKLANTGRETLNSFNIESEQKDEKHIEDMSKLKILSANSFAEYKKYRTNIDFIPMIMVFIASHLGLNFIFETVSGEWLPKFMQDNSSDYFQVVVYPSTNEENLIKRTASRALEEFRFVDPTTFPDMIANANKMFNNLILNNTYENIYLYKYDNNMGNKEQISQGDFTSIPILQKKLVIKNRSP